MGNICAADGQHGAAVDGDILHQQAQQKKPGKALGCFPGQQSDARAYMSTVLVAMGYFTNFVEVISVTRGLAFSVESCG